MDIGTLEDWAAAGGHWRVSEASGGAVDVDLCACTGETMERARLTDPEVVEYLSRHPEGPPDPSLPASAG